MDVYGEKVLKELGLPTAINKIEDLNYFQILKLPPTVDDERLIADAASKQIRRLREWQKEPYRDFAGRMELAIVKARNALKDTQYRAALRARLQSSPKLAAATKAISQLKQPGGKWPQEAAAHKHGAIPWWVNLIILLALVLAALLAVQKMGGFSLIWQQLKSAMSGG